MWLAVGAALVELVEREPSAVRRVLLDRVAWPVLPARSLLTARKNTVRLTDGLANGKRRYCGWVTRH